jgi:hypothetical protein
MPGVRSFSQVFDASIQSRNHRSSILMDMYTPFIHECVGEQVLKMQITSVTDIPPENQTITGLGTSPLHDLSDRECHKKKDKNYHIIYFFEIHERKSAKETSSHMYPTIVMEQIESTHLHAHADLLSAGSQWSNLASRKA